MAQPVTPERRNEILSAVKDQGLSVAQASQQFQVHPTTLRKWIRSTVKHSSATSSEVQRLRKEIAFLKEIVADFFLEKKVAEKK